MNSLLITDTYLPRIGGRENYYHHLFNRFEEGEVVVVTPDQTGDCGRFDRESKLPIFRINRANRTWFIDGRRARARWLWRLRSLCRRHQIDVVHCGVILPDGLSGWFLSRTLGKPYIAYAFGKEILENQQDPRLAKRMDIAFSAASRVVSISRYTTEMVKASGVPSDKIVQIPPGVDARRFASGVSSERADALRQAYGLSSKVVILTVGRLVERKGVDRVMESLPRLLERFPEAAYLVVGEGPDRRRLERLRDSLGLEKQVIFTGLVSQEDLLACYELATLFVMVSRQPTDSCEIEGFGIVYLEANAAGLPVVAGASGGAVDAVVDGRTGFLVDPVDPDAIAGAILRLLEDPELRRRLGSFGRERATESFSWERMAGRLERLTGEVGAAQTTRSPFGATTQALPLLLQRDLFGAARGDRATVGRAQGVRE